MATHEKATPGNKLYIYRLLRSTIGTGKQEFLPNVETILTNDDVYPEDMGFGSTLEMLRAFSEFVNLTEFKGGRVYVRLVARDDWDKWLDAAESEKNNESKPKIAKGKAKPWKHAKKGPKVVRPVKPKHKARLMPEPEEGGADANAARLAKESVSSEASNDAAPAEGASKSEASAQTVGDNAENAVEESSRRATPVPLAKATNVGTAKTQQMPTETAGQRPATTSQDPPVPTPQQLQRESAGVVQAEGDRHPKAESSAQAEGQDQPAVTQKAKPTIAPSFPRIRLRIVSDGSENDADETPSERPGDVTVQNGSTPSGTVSTAASATAAKRPARTTEDTGTSPAADAPTTAGTAATPDAAFMHEGEQVGHRAAAADHGTPVSPVEAPLAPALNEAERSRTSSLPASFWNEVHCKDELLSILTRTLPFDVDLTRVLEEDWQVARATGMATGTRSKVVFPIRYLRPDGSHIELTIRRISRPLGGKHWALSLVDGDDGTGTLHEAAGLEGAPQGDEGAWQDLSATLLPADLRVSPLRELAQFCSIGSWDATLGALTSMAAPERWDYPDEGVGRASRFGILREYLCVTLHRLHEQHRVAVSPAGDLCVANTGLMTTMTEDIYACFTPSRGGSPQWDFAGFAVAGSGEFGRRITATFDPLPQPASYIQSLDQVMPHANKLVALDYRTIVGRQLDRMPRGFLQEQFERHAEAAPLLDKAFASDASQADRSQALRELGRAATSDPGLYRRLCLALDDAVTMAKHRVRASFRLCAPAYDPQTGLVDLLLPLALIADGQADCALVLEPQPSGNYQASSILSLPRAYACARVISKYQPAWLLPENVLADK